MAGKKQYKRSTGTKPLNHEKPQIWAEPVLK